MHAVSFVLLSSLTLFIAIRLRFWLGRYLFLAFGLLSLWQFAYLTVAIRRFYLARGRWGGWLLSVAAALLLYVLNTVFMTAVQVAGAAIALALILCTVIPERKRHGGLRVRNRRDTALRTEEQDRATLRHHAGHRASRSLLDPLQRTPLVATAPGVGKCLKTSLTSSNTRLSRFSGFDV